jgi:hypothetical protein
VPPESERLLSIGEIFGHKHYSLPRTGETLWKWCQVPSSLPV